MNGSMNDHPPVPSVSDHWRRSHPTVLQFPQTLPHSVTGSSDKGSGNGACVDGARVDGASVGGVCTIKDAGYWQSTAATNQRLLHVLSDLVKAFIDTESEIQSNLEQLGFIDGGHNSGHISGHISGHFPDEDFNGFRSSDGGNNSTLKVPKDADDVLSSLEDAMTANGNCSSSPGGLPNGTTRNGHSGHFDGGHFSDAGHFLEAGQEGNNNLTKRSKRRQGMADDVHVEFADDGPDLIPPSFSFSVGSDLSPSEISQLSIDDDVVLGASRRLRTAVDRILNLLKRVAAIQLLDGRSNGASSNEKSANPSQSESEIRRLEKETRRLEKEVEEVRRVNRVLQEEVNSKHLQLSSLRARVDSCNILDAQSLREDNGSLRIMNDTLRQKCDSLTQKNDTLTQKCDSLTQKNDTLTQKNDTLRQRIQELTGHLHLAESRSTQFAFAVNTLRTQVEDRDKELERLRGHFPVAGHSQSCYRSIEAARDESSAFDLHESHLSPMADKMIKPYEMDHEDDSDHVSVSDDGDDHGHDSEHEHEQDALHSITSSIFNPNDLTKLYKKIVDTKNCEIAQLRKENAQLCKESAQVQKENVQLREQMTLAQEMISSAFPGNCTPPSAHGDPVIHLIQQLVSECTKGLDHGSLLLLENERGGKSAKGLDHGSLFLLENERGGESAKGLDHGSLLLLENERGGESARHRGQMGQQTPLLSHSPRPLSPPSSTTSYRDCDPEMVSVGTSTSPDRPQGRVASNVSKVASNVSKVTSQKEPGLETVLDGDISSWSEGQVSNDSYVDVQKLDTKLGQLHACVEKLIRSNNYLKIELDNVRSEREAEREEKERIRLEKQRISEEKNSLLKERETEKKERETEKKERETEKKERETEKKERERIIEENEKEWRKKVASLERQVKTLRCINQTLEERVVVVSSECEDLRQELEERVAAVSSECEDLRQEHESLIHDRDSALRDRDSALRDRDSALRDNARLKSVHDRIEEELREVERRVGSESDLKSYHEGRVKDHEGRVKDHEGRVKDHESRVKEVKSYHEGRVKDHEGGVKGEKERQIQELEGRMNSAYTSTNHPHTPCHTLERLRKVEHDARALVYQKRYLLNLLGGFQLTERATLALIANMDVSLDESPPPTPFNRFRSAVFVTISLTRMKILARKRKFHSRSIHTGTQITSSMSGLSRRTSTGNLTSTPRSVLRGSKDVSKKDVSKKDVSKDDQLIRSRKSSTASTSSSVSRYQEIILHEDQNKSMEEFASRLERLSAQASFVRDRQRQSQVE